jgi:hypothetical protein
MTTLYLSMSANEKDLEIEDDLAKGGVIKSAYMDGWMLTGSQPKRSYETSNLKFPPSRRRTLFWRKTSDT